MLIYEVTATVRAELADAYEHYLRTEHIPDLLTTGCFVGARIAQAGVGRYRITYDMPDSAALDRYLAEHAPRLRADVRLRFPDGLDLEREVWTVKQSWPA
jgi:inhibitor of KinA sporulation pathway (predicted exonuclease)